jgi:hypothetical protein
MPLAHSTNWYVPDFVCLNVKMAAEMVPKGQARTVGKLGNVGSPSQSGTKTSGGARPMMIEIPRGPEVVYERKPEDDVDSDDGEAEPEQVEPEPEPVKPKMARTADGRHDDESWRA